MAASSRKGTSSSSNDEKKPDELPAREEKQQPDHDPRENASRAESAVKQGDLAQPHKSRADFIRAQEASQWAPEEADAVRESDPDKADVIQRVHTGDRSGDSD
jgi:hypothetical protein